MAFHVSEEWSYRLHLLDLQLNFCIYRVIVCGHISRVGHTTMIINAINDALVVTIYIDGSIAVKCEGVDAEVMVDESEYSCNPIGFS